MSNPALGEFVLGQYRIGTSTFIQENLLEKELLARFDWEFTYPPTKKWQLKPFRKKRSSSKQTFSESLDKFVS
jgi:hypothetical protein